MTTLAGNRIQEAYRELGRVLDDPGSFGLSQGISRALEHVLIGVRRKLLEAFVENKELGADEDWLTAELSQDADRGNCPFAKRR
jgi:hypothetical protein